MTATAHDIAGGVRRAARATPDKVGLSEDDRHLTYRELVSRIDRIASLACHGLNLTRGDRAAVMLPNRLEFMEIVFGLASMGIAPAMISPRSAVAEIEHICNDSGARVLLVDESTQLIARSADLPTVDRVILLGDEYDQLLNESRGRPPRIALDASDVFCIPYTSGTTGKAKGVLLSHRSRAQMFPAMDLEYKSYSCEDRTLGIAPLYHGGGFAHSAAAIYQGGYCSLVTKFDPEIVLRKLEAERISNTFMIPTHFSAILELDQTILRKSKPSFIKTIVSNAAPLSEKLKRRIVEYFGDTVLFEAYGSTEAGIVSNLPPADQLRKPTSVGLPFQDTEIRLLDAAGVEVREGEIGELYSRSPFMFSGYWQRRAETDRALRDGWVTAGDLARRDDEGFIYMVDRRDDKIISGGTNIYPRQVEDAIGRHPAVAEIVVFGIPDDRWGEAVHAVIRLEAGAEVTSDDLIAFGAEQISRSMLPKSIVYSESIPRSAAGKVLRKEMREPYWKGRPRGIS